MLVLILKKNNKIREFVESSTCFVLALITSVLHWEYLKLKLDNKVMFCTWILC